MEDSPRPADETRHRLGEGCPPPDPDRVFGALLGAAIARADEVDELAPALAALAAHFGGASGGPGRRLREALGGREGAPTAKAAARGLVAAFTPTPAAWGAHLAEATETAPWAGAAAALVAGLALAAADGSSGAEAVAAATALLEGEARGRWIAALTEAAPVRDATLKLAGAALRAFRSGRAGAGFWDLVVAAEPEHREVVGGLCGAALGLKRLPDEGLEALFAGTGSDCWLSPIEGFISASAPVWRAQP